MNGKPKILYVEDDIDLGYVTRDNLELKGYKITLLKDGKSALDVFINKQFDLCLLDVMLPEMDGFTLAKEIRKVNEHIPIIFLSAKSLKEDRIEGLVSGGDDYLTKPFNIAELVLKIEIFLRRNRKTITNSDNETISFGHFQFDRANLQLAHDGGAKRLTSREAELLSFLVSNRNKILKKEEILNAVWGDDSYFNSRSLDVFVSKLRKYLKSDKRVNINNIHGIGFILTIEE
jgi:DNA-binding response OmpR family regulator